MKRSALVFLLAIAGPLHAAPIDDAAALLKAGKYPEAAAAFAALPPDAGEPGYAAYLKALSLHLADRQDEAIAAAGAVPADSPWRMKARFLMGAALTKAKKHREAEAIYAAEATRYAFHRGNTVLQANIPQEVPQSSGGAASPKPSNRKVLEKGEYLKNIDESNKAVQKQQIQSWDSKRRSNSNGVEASDVMKK